MRKPPRALVLLVTLPFLAGCVGTFAQPMPEPSARPSSGLRGVVLGDAETGERVEFARVDFVQWTDSTLAITGVRRGDAMAGSAGITTNTYRTTDIAALLVRQVDPDKTSLLVAGVFVGVGVIAAILFTGKTTSGTVF